MKSELKTIKQASFVKRILAIIMDGSVAVFTFFAFFILVFSPIATKAFKYKAIVKEASDLQLSSQLYVLESENASENTPICYINEEPEFFKERLHFYYLDYKVNLAPDKDAEITKENGEKVLPKDYYTEEWFAELISPLDSVEKWQKASKDALIDFSKYLSEYQMHIKRIELFIIMPSYFLSFGIYFILVPLLYRNGETFGKKVMGIGFVTKDGYSIKKRQTVLRQLFMLFLTTFSCFIIGIGTTSFVTLGAGVFVYYLAAFISKSKRSMSDYLAYTYLIDTKNSVWFDDVQHEEQKEKILEDNLSKYNKDTEDNKHIIQVGSKIVNKEVEEEYLKSKEESKKNE